MKNFYLDSLTIEQLKSLLPSIYHWVIMEKIKEKENENTDNKPIL